MAKQILGIVAGVIASFVIIYIVEALGHLLYPPPADLNLSEPERLAQYMKTAPVGGLLMVLLAWLIGIMGGVWVAGMIAKTHAMRNAAIIGGLVLLGTIANLVMIPHPTWFSILSVMAIAAMIYFSGKITAKALAS